MLGSVAFSHVKNVSLSATHCVFLLSCVCMCVCVCVCARMSASVFVHVAADSIMLAMSVCVGLKVYSDI